MSAMAATARPKERCCSKQWPENGTLSLVSLYSLCSGIVQQWWLASGAFPGVLSSTIHDASTESDFIAQIS
jgi:hypothetical protein